MKSAGFLKPRSTSALAKEFIQFPVPCAFERVFRSEFDVAYEEGGLFILTMHPNITGHRSRIAGLEKLIVHMKSKPGVWFATHEQIARYVKQSATSN